jgi:DNA-binding beta-propeller fold protein YncE
VVTARFGVQQPTSVVFDPVTGLFVAASSLGNQLLLLNTDTQQASGLRVGINPTALAYNFQSSTMVTVNTVSNTISVIDFIDRRVRAVLSSSLAPHCLNPILVGTGAQQVLQQPPCGADIHPRTNLGVFVDGDNNRLLLMPLPR